MKSHDVIREALPEDYLEQASLNYEQQSREIFVPPGAIVRYGDDSQWAEAVRRHNSRGSGTPITLLSYYSEGLDGRLTPFILDTSGAQLTYKLMNIIDIEGCIIPEEAQQEVAEIAINGIRKRQG